MTDMEFTPIATPLRKPPADPVAALAAALHNEWDRRTNEPSEPGVPCLDCLDSAAAISAALDDAGFALMPKASVAAMMRDLSDRASEIARLTRERDLVIAHDRQPYPTTWAYEQVCRIRDKYRTALAECIQPCHECDAADIARAALSEADHD